MFENNEFKKNQEIKEIKFKDCQSYIWFKFIMFPSWVGIVPENWFEYRYLLFSTIYEIWNRNNGL